MNYTYVLRRLLLAVVTFLVASSATFIILSVLPGDLAVAMLGDNATQESVAQLRAELGLNAPVWTRYLAWMSDLLRGDLGRSLLHNEPVAKLMASRLPVTLELAMLGTLMGAAVGLPVGVLTAVKRGSLVDLAVRPLSLIGLSVPSFWLGLLVLLLPSYLWNYPPPRYTPLWEAPFRNLQLVLPVAAITGLSFMAGMTRLSRTAMLEVLGEDYVRTARAKGLPERSVIYRHALRNAMIPVLTLVSLTFAGSLGGSVILESIFSIPGIGQQALSAISKRDYPIVQGFVVFNVLIYVSVNLIVDILTGLLDPRVRLQ